MAEGKNGYDIATAYIRIMPSTDKFGSSIKGSMEKEGETAGGHFSSGFKTGLKALTVVTAAATAAVGKVVSDAVQEFAEYEQLVGGVKKIFGEVDFQGVLNNANEAFRTAGLSANEYMETVTSFSASLIQSLGGDTEAAVQYADTAISDMSDNANTFGTDIASIQNAYQGFAKQNYTMLDNLKLGYGGTKSEMERLILDAEALDSSFKATRDSNGDLALSFSDIVEAIHIVQEDMGIAGTTAAEASTTIQGSVSSMKAAWHNLLIGLTDDSQDFDTLMSNLIETIVGVEDGSGNRVGGVINNIMPRVTQALEGLGTFVKELIPELVAYIPEILGAVLPGLLESAGALVESFLGALPDIITVVAEQLPGLLQSLGDSIVSGLESLTEQLPTLADSLSGVLSSILTYVAENADTLITAFADFLTTLITEGIGILADNSEELATALLAVVKAVIKAAIEHPELIALIAGGKAIKSLGTMLIGTIGGGITGAKDKIISAISSLFSSTSIGQSVTSAGTSLGQGLSTASGTAFSAGLSAVFSTIAASGIIVAGAALIWKAYSDYIDSMIKSDPGFQEFQARNNELYNSNLSVAESYQVLKDYLDSMPNAWEAVTGDMSNHVAKGEELIAILDETDGSWEAVYREMGYADVAAQGMSRSDELLEHTLYDVLLQAREQEAIFGTLTDTTEETAESTVVLSDAEADLAAATEATMSQISDMYSDTFGTDIPEVLDSAVQDATQAGIDIPAGMVQGLNEGQIAEQSAIDRMNALVNFDAAVNAAGIGGTTVSQSFVDSWLAGEYDWTTANNYLNSLVDFTDAINNASENGYEVTAEFVNALIDDYGLQGVVDASTLLSETAVPNVMTDEISDAGTAVPTILADNMEDSAYLAGDASRVIYDEVVDGLDELPDDMQTTGDDSGSNLDSGFRSWADSVDDAVYLMYGFFEDQLGSGLSSNMMTWGYSAGEEFASGIDLSSWEISDTAYAIYSEVALAFAELEGDLYSSGYYAGQGFYNGLDEWYWSVSNLAWDMANEIKSAANEALDIGSPSRVMMQIGEYAAEGLAIGLDRGSEQVLSSVEAMADGVISMSGSSDLIHAMEQNGYDYSNSFDDIQSQTDENIGDTLNQIVLLLDKVSKMQMVTDTGVLVGELAEPMNQEFNAIRLREERG